MKKILILLSFFMILGTTLCTGQFTEDSRGKFKLGVKAGANYSNIYDSDGEGFDAEGKFGFAGGAFMMIPLGKVLGIQPEVLFSQRGYKQTGTFLGGNYELTRTTNYIDIPIFLSIKPASFITVQLGPQFSFLTKRKDVFKNPLSTIEQEKEFANDDFRKNTLCAVGGVDININQVVLGVRAGWDVQDNNGSGTSTNPRYKNVWLQASLGFLVF
jgi:hypothetical protein